jgi:hypothetical protein
MATCKRYSIRAMRCDAMRCDAMRCDAIRAAARTTPRPPLCSRRGGADLCAICARGCGRAASRCATRVRESLDNKEIGRQRDRQTGRTRSPRPRVGISNALATGECSSPRAAGDVVVVVVVVVCSRTSGRGRRVYPPMPASEEGLIFFVNICRLPPARRKSWGICIIGGTRRKRNIAVRWLGSRPSRAASAEYTAEGEATEETDCIGKIP